MSVVITFNELAKLASQLPPADKRRLAGKLEQETDHQETKTANEPSAEPQLTPAQRKTWKNIRQNIRQGFEELQRIRDGKAQAQSSDDYLTELKAEGYL